MQMQDRVGQQFGNYRLIHLIGRGGHAEVYLAEHVYLKNLQHAIKVLTGTNLEDYKQDEFLFEARTIASLQLLSSHIVQIRDFGIQPSQNGGVDCSVPYIVMEYASEGTLRSLYRQGVKVPLERIVFYVNQVAEALQCAHDHNPPIVHRDVKPENMLLRNIDHVLLSDFGIAVTGLTGPLTISKKAGVIGTAAYIAPERFSGHMRRASDQYSLGVVVYEWLCGSRPFDGTDTEICARHIKAQPPALYPVYPHITKEIENVVMRALAKKPEDRYPTIQAFAHALEVAIDSALQQNQHPWSSTGNTGGAQKQQSASDVTGLPTVQVSPPQHQTGQWSGVYPPQRVHPQHISGTTEPFISSQSLPISNPVSRPPLKRIRDFFELSPQFASDRRYSFFRTSGLMLNILSAFLIYLVLQNIYILCGALLFSSLTFALCIRAIEEKLAMFFGMLVALYWGWVGLVTGTFLATLLHSYPLLTSLCVGFIFLIVSGSLHIWYVSRKNL